MSWNPLLKHRLSQQLSHLRPKLFRVAYSWSHAEDLADDLVQETCLKALQSAKNLRDEQALHSWCFKIMTNCWRDHLRKRRPEQDIDEIVLTDDKTLEDLQIRRDVTRLVQKAISHLPMGQREVVTLVELEGFAYAEVADILDIPIGTVMSRLCRARNNLSQQLLDLREPGEQGQTASLRRIK